MAAPSEDDVRFSPPVRRPNQPFFRVVFAFGIHVTPGLSICS